MCLCPCAWARVAAKGCSTGARNGSRNAARGQLLDGPQLALLWGGPQGRIGGAWGQSAMIRRATACSHGALRVKRRSSG